jgi:hypothetical protein
MNSTSASRCAYGSFGSTLCLWGSLLGRQDEALCFRKIGCQAITKSPSVAASGGLSVKCELAKPRQAMPAPPSIAVVIPCFNADKWIARAIRSVLDQGYPNLQLIVIDDGSEDASLSEIQVFGDALTCEAAPHSGASAARNRGLRRAQADCTVFLDADDYQRPGFLQYVSAAFSATHADMIFAATLNEFENGPAVLTKPDKFRRPLESVIAGWIMGEMAQTGAIAWKTSFINNLGPWNERLTWGEDDWEFGLRALLAEPKIATAPDATTVYVHHSGANRLTSRRGVGAVVSFLQLMEVFSEHPYVTENRSAQEALGERMYGLARYCFSLRSACDLTEKCGRHALDRSYELTGNREFGGFVHRLLSRTIGLKHKERVFRFARDLVETVEPLRPSLLYLRGAIDKTGARRS